MAGAGSFRDQDTYVAWYDSYDKAIMYWFLNNVKRAGKAVPCVFATPERAFGQLAKVLSGKHGRTYTEKTVPLPFMSLTRLTDRLDHARRWSRGRLRKMQIWDQYGNRSFAKDSTPTEAQADRVDSWEGMEYPQPIVMTYQLEVWVRILRDLDLIKNRILQALDLGDTVYLAVEHPEPFGLKLRPLILEGIQNTSQLEAAEGKERTLRETYSFALEAYIPRPSTRTKAVKAAEVEFTVETDVHDGITGAVTDTEEVIDEQTLYDLR